MNTAACDARELADAATVHAAREGVVHALAPLAASPLDEQAADQMRLALAKATSPVVREALRRLVATPRPTQRPTLNAVPSTAGGDRAADRPASTTPHPGPCQPTPAAAGGGA
jgi:broad specificity polyphosphatase/5'/3'-nucleotidase SurE